VPVAPADPATQANDTVLKPTPDGDALPSVYGTGLEKYVSKKTFSITMPSIDISDLGVAHPTDPTNATALLAPLQYGVGHLFSYPGEGSTILIYGHSSNYPWDVSGFAKIFRQINRLKAGDKVYVTYGGKFIVYQVTGSQTIPADDLAAVSSGGEGEELVLYTCWPPDHIKQRYLVRAVPIAQYSI
jgi:LPXTG-site transpeptidase (sortase) family protein